MAENKYDLGELVRVSCPFTDAILGGAIDPDVVKLSVRTPAPATTTYTYGVGPVIVKDSVGNYHADIDANAAGTWYYRWWSTGSGQAADEKHFEVVQAKAV